MPPQDLSRRMLHMKLAQTVDEEEWTPMPGISINASGKGVQVKSRVALPPAYERLEQQFAAPGPESAEPLQALSSEASGEDHTSSEPSTSDRSTWEAGASTSAASPLASSSSQPSYAAPPSMGQDATASTSTTDSMDLESEPQFGGIPKSILIISLVSASLTMASCVFNTLLPVYMVSELKMTMKSMGMFEGLLEAFSYIVRM
jgi:hypothetical protein